MRDLRTGVGGEVSAYYNEIEPYAAQWLRNLIKKGLIYAPDKAWADMVITQTGNFPKGKHDDLVDTVSMGLKHLRELGLLVRGAEWTADVQDQMRHSGAPPQPLYPV